MKTLSGFLVEAYVSDLTDLEDTFNTIDYRGETVCEDEYDDQHGCTTYRVVKKFVIDHVERYFEYYDCNPKSDEVTREDCGWEFPHPDDMREVFPNYVMTTVYN